MIDYLFANIGKYAASLRFDRGENTNFVEWNLLHSVRKSGENLNYLSLKMNEFKNQNLIITISAGSSKAKITVKADDILEIKKEGEDYRFNLNDNTKLKKFIFQRVYSANKPIEIVFLASSELKQSINNQSKELLFLQSNINDPFVVLGKNPKYHTIKLFSDIEKTIEKGFIDFTLNMATMCSLK